MRIAHRFAQACISAVGFPDDFDHLDAMIAKNSDADGALTDIDNLLRFRPGDLLTWTAPKWLTAGDLLFFYHTKSARDNLRLVREDVEDTAPSNDDLWPIVARAEEQLALYSGTIFGCALVAGRPEYESNPADAQHFRGRIFAPLAEVEIFKRPVSIRAFSQYLTLSPGATITPLHGATLSDLVACIALTNTLPPFIAEARPGTAGLRDVTSENWLSIVCQPGCAFIDESQLRAYFLDHLLQAVKDPRSSVHAECTCLRDGSSTGIADYFVRINGHWIPVEAKLNVRAEVDLPGQIRRYLGADWVIPRRGSSRGERIEVSRPRIAMVVDQWGLYLVVDGEFIGDGLDCPLWQRLSLEEDTPGRIRAHIQTLQSGLDAPAT